MFSPPAALQQRRQQQQQLQGASATRLFGGRAANAGARRSPLGRFHMLASRSATREGSTLFTRGGGLEEGGAPPGPQESNEEEGEGGDADADALPAEPCSGGADLGLSESDPEVWEIISAERRRQVGGRNVVLPLSYCCTFCYLLLKSTAAVVAPLVETSWSTA